MTSSLEIDGDVVMVISSLLLSSNVVVDDVKSFVAMVTKSLSAGCVENETSVWLALTTASVSGAIVEKEKDELTAAVLALS